MLIVGVDVETTSLDSNTGEIVELGCVLYDTKSERVISVFGKVYKVDKWGVESAECHQIPEHVSNMMPLISEDDINPWKAISGSLSEYVVAHNAAHDHGFVTKIFPDFKNKPWICTQRDLNHADIIGKVSSQRLAHLCVDYHITMGSWHQAVADAEACARIAGKHDLNEAYIRKNTPKFRFVAYGAYIKDVSEIMSKVPSVIADGRKYRWNTDEAPKAWSKSDLTLADIELDAKFLKKATKGAWKFEGIPMPPKAY